LRINSKAERAIKSGHPWVFEKNILECKGDRTVAGLAVIYDSSDKMLALGIFDPKSPIAFRVLHLGRPVELDTEWWCGRLKSSLDQRLKWFDRETTGFRCIHGENDGWPGLVLDRYAGCFVCKIYSPFWIDRIPLLKSLFSAELNCFGTVDSIILRWSRNIAPFMEPLADGKTFIQLLGSTDGKAQFLENGNMFEADVFHGQKTGFFLDQRENRKIVQGMSGGKKVLNCFSYSGGFSVYAARGGAREVVSVDTDERALTAARRNFELNRDDPQIRSAVHTTARSDVFEFLKSAGQKFDLVILDPPSMASRESDKDRALNAYENLIRSGARFCGTGGILVAASCSAHVHKEDFFPLALQTLKKTGRPFKELLTTGHPQDHHATFREAEYLKAIYFKFQ